MINFKDSAVAWFKDKRYWEGVFVGAVTTLFGEWVAIAASSALVNKGVIQPGRASETPRALYIYFSVGRTMLYLSSLARRDSAHYPLQ